MKTFYFYLLLLFTAFTTRAQQLTFSEPFEINDKDEYKIFVTSAGNTYFFTANYYDLSIDVYDTTHKLVSHQVKEAEELFDDKKTAFRVDEIVESEKYITVFLCQILGQQEELNLLYRMVLTKVDGKFQKVERMYPTADTDARPSYKNSFAIVKDNASSCYAILFTEPNISKRKVPAIVVKTYNADNNQVDSFTSPGYINKMVKVSAGGICMYNGVVYFGYYSSFDDYGKSVRTEYHLCNLKFGSGKTDTATLDLKFLFSTGKTILGFNGTTNTLQLAVCTEVSSKEVGKYLAKEIVSTMCFIDAEKMNVMFTKLLTQEKLQTYVSRVYNSKGYVAGSIKKMYIDKDGTTAVLFGGGEIDEGEEMTFIMDEIGVEILDKTGNEEEGYVLRRALSNATNGNYKERKYGEHNFMFSGQNKYVILNDDRQYITATPKRVGRISVFDAYTIMHKLNADLDKTAFLYGNPDEQQRITAIASSFFDEERQMYAAVTSDRKGRDGKIVWITLKQ